MSFHGGFLGVIIAVLIYSLVNRMPLWSVADLIAISSPPGLFFGSLQISLMQNCGAVQPMFRGELFFREKGHKIASE